MYLAFEVTSRAMRGLRRCPRNAGNVIPEKFGRTRGTVENRGVTEAPAAKKGRVAAESLDVPPGRELARAGVPWPDDEETEV